MGVLNAVGRGIHFMSNITKREKLVDDLRHLDWVRGGLIHVNQIYGYYLATGSKASNIGNLQQCIPEQVYHPTVNRIFIAQQVNRTPL